jgi:hypothetical protein
MEDLMRKISILLAILIFSTNMLAQVQTDKQLWTNVDFIVGLKKEKDSNGKTFDRIAMNLSLINRFGDDISRPVDQRIGATFDFRVNKFLTLSAGYLYQKATPSKTIKNYESRLSFAATLSKRFGNINLKTRQQIEHKFRNGREDNKNYRPLFQANYFVVKNDKELFSPFVSNESYYDTLSKSWNRNEFRAGITKSLNKKVSADFYYIRLDTKTLDANGLGLGLRFKLR